MDRSTYIRGFWTGWGVGLAVGAIVVSLFVSALWFVLLTTPPLFGAVVVHNRPSLRFVSRASCSGFPTV